MMKFRMKNESGGEFEFEGDAKAFNAVLGKLGGSVFGPIRTQHDAHASAATASRRAPERPTSRDSMTTNAISVRLGFKSGPDLFLAAATKLTLYDEKETFTRSEVLKEMSSATSFFTQNHRKNLSKYVQKLIADKRLNERSKGLYVLAMETRTEIAQKLGVRPPQ
jgi:hypothetical protein